MRRSRPTRPAKEPRSGPREPDGPRSGPGEPDGPRSGPREKGELAGVVHRNIAALLAFRRRTEAARSVRDRVVDGIAAFAGSLPFVALHAAIVVGWFAINLRLVPGVAPFDPYPFVMLAMAASVEAIFLSTFILIRQNRLQRLDETRAELDLQINLLAEHEITRLISLTEAIARTNGIEIPGGDLAELKEDVAPEQVLAEIDKHEKSAADERATRRSLRGSHA